MIALWVLLGLAGLLLCLLPGALPGLNGKERLFSCVGAATMALGFLPLAL